MAARKGSVKWSIPDVDVSSSARTPRTFRSHAQSASDNYSDTFVDLTQSHVYSDTFVSDSYSDTFINGSATGTTLSTNGADKFSNSHTVTTDEIQTVISLVPDAVKGQQSYQIDKTNNATEIVDTTVEADTNITEVADTRISEAIETEIETHTSHSEGTAIDTVYSASDTHPPDSYTDTFETSERTRADVTDYDTYSKADSFTGTESDSYTQSYTQTDSEQYTQSDDRSQLESYSSYGEKTVSDADSDQDTFDDEYSYTFEPTESSHVPVDPEQILREAEIQRKTEEAGKQFMNSMVMKLKSAGQAQDTRKLERLSPKPEIPEEDDYLVHYCKKKLKLLKQNRKPADVSVSEEPHPLLAHRPALLADYGIDPIILERAKIRNIMSAMEKAAKEEVHDPRQCHKCREDNSRLDAMEAERQFVLTHAKSMQNRIIDRRVEEHLLKMNTVSMIAEIARELPRHAEKPEIIMDKLFEPLLGKNVMR